MVNLDLKRNANKNFTEKPFFTYQINKKLMGTQHTLWIDLGKTGTLTHTSGHANGTTLNEGKLITSCKITQAFTLYSLILHLGISSQNTLITI